MGLCCAAICAGKIITIGPFNVPCSNIVFSFLTFPLTDIIAEIWGKPAAKYTVWLGFSAQLLFVLLIQASIYLPFPEFWHDQPSYQQALHLGPRVICASMVAFLFSQFWDVYCYCKLKQWTDGRCLWLRNNVSTFTSQLINSVIFNSIIFYDSGNLMTLITSSLGLKWIIALIDTPLVYAAVAIIRHTTASHPTSVSRPIHLS